MNGGASGRGVKHGTAGTVSIPSTSGGGSQLAVCNRETAEGFRVEVFAKEYEHKGRHPHSYFVNQVVLLWQGKAMPATIREVRLSVRVSVCLWVPTRDRLCTQKRNPPDADKRQHKRPPPRRRARTGEERYFVQCTLSPLPPKILLTGG